MRFLRPFLGMLLAVTTGGSAVAQAGAYGRTMQGERHERGAGGCHVGGVVAQITSDHLAVKTDSGVYYGIFYYSSTQFLKTAPHAATMAERQPTFGRRPQGEQRIPPQPITISDIQNGDTILGFGQFDAQHHTVAAVRILKLDPERAARFPESHEVGRGCFSNLSEGVR